MSFYTYSDLVIGQIFGASLKNLSVITFYATIVLAIGRLIRGVFDQIIMRVSIPTPKYSKFLLFPKVVYEEMPYCEEIIEFCDSIYMARRDGDLVREQKLYELLIRMYRSPEILINLTKDYLYKDMEDTNNHFYNDHKKLNRRKRGSLMRGSMTPRAGAVKNKLSSYKRRERTGSINMA